MPSGKMSVDLRPPAHVTGMMLVVLGATMIIPAAVDFTLGDPNAMAFVLAATITLVTGGLLAVASATRNLRAISVRQAFVLTVAVWTVLPAFGALPLVIGAPGLGWTDAYFESVSGMTTTGSSMIAGLDRLPASTNLWRGMLNWLGGLGIAFVAMIFLPVMRVGGITIRLYLLLPTGSGTDRYPVVSASCIRADFTDCSGERWYACEW